MELETPDAALVERARDGDRGAFGALVARHRVLLLGLCRRALGDPRAAEDVAQEAILHAWLGLDRLRQPEQFGSWLGGIGLNVCRRWRRGQSRETWSWEAMLGGRFIAEPVDAGPGPEEIAEAADLRARVRQAVAHLPHGQRAAVTLFYLQGLTHAETAALLGVEVGAVKTRLHKARQNLRRQLLAGSSAKEQAMDQQIDRRTLAKTAGALAGIAAVRQLAPAEAAAEGSTLIEMRVEDVRRHGADEGEMRHVIVLHEIDGERTLPIWVGEFEATALALQVERVEAPRPLSYALMAGVLQAAGGRLREVRISRLVGDVFYAEVVVEGHEGVQTVDARPSDALNLAALTGAPIRVDPAVLATTDSPTVRHRVPENTESAAAIVAGFMAGPRGSLLK